MKRILNWVKKSSGVPDVVVSVVVVLLGAAMLVRSVTVGVEKMEFISYLLVLIWVELVRLNNKGKLKRKETNEWENEVGNRKRL